MSPHPPKSCESPDGESLREKIDRLCADVTAIKRELIGAELGEDSGHVGLKARVRTLEEGKADGIDHAALKVRVSSLETDKAARDRWFWHVASMALGAIVLAILGLVLKAPVQGSIVP